MMTKTFVQWVTQGTITAGTTQPLRICPTSDPYQGAYGTSWARLLTLHCMDLSSSDCGLTQPPTTSAVPGS